MKKLYSLIVLCALSMMSSAEEMGEMNKFFIGTMSFSKLAGGCDYATRIGDWQFATNKSREMSEKLDDYDNKRLGRVKGDTEKLCIEADVAYKKVTREFGAESEFKLKLIFDNAFFNGYCGMIYGSANIFKGGKSADLFLQFLNSEALRLGYSNANTVISACALGLGKYQADMAKLGYTP
jgi:hypothetical protein